MNVFDFNHKKGSDFRIFKQLSLGKNEKKEESFIMG